MNGGVILGDPVTKNQNQKIINHNTISIMHALWIVPPRPAKRRTFEHGPRIVMINTK